MYWQSVLSYSALLFFTFCGFSNGQGVDWQTDLDAARKRAAAENRLILLHFSADWCRPCKELERFVFSSIRVSEAIDEQLIPVHINTDDHPDLVKEFAISEIPADVVISPKGRVITKRRSPKTADDYIRMVKTLPSGKEASDHGDLEMTQKIDRILAAAAPKTVTTKSNDFTPPGAVAGTVKPSAESSKLLEESNARAKLVMHEVEQSANEKKMDMPKPQESQTVAQSAPSSKRIINDTFFSEKSDRENGVSNHALANQAQSNQFLANTTPNTPLKPAAAASKSGKQLASAKINNPFEKSANAAMQTSAAAKIVTTETEQYTKGSPLTPGLATNSNTFEPANSRSGNSDATGFEPSGVLKPRTSQGALKPSGSQAMLTESPSESQTHQPMKKFESSQPDIRFAKTGSEAKIAKPADKTMDSMAKSAVVNRNEKEFALDGKCPVTLIKDGKWADGDAGFGCVHRGRTYIFADAEKLKVFQDDPESYSPILAGYDPVMFHEQGEMVDGNAKHGVFMGKAPDLRIVLFSTKETRAKFQADPRKFMTTIRTAVEQSGRSYR